MYVPETNNVAEETVVPVDERDLTVASVECDFEEGTVYGVEVTKDKAWDVICDVKPDIVGENGGRHGGGEETGIGWAKRRGWICQQSLNLISHNCSLSPRPYLQTRHL